MTLHNESTMHKIFKKPLILTIVPLIFIILFLGIFRESLTHKNCSVGKVSKFLKMCLLWQNYVDSFSKWQHHSSWLSQMVAFFYLVGYFRKLIILKNSKTIDLKKWMLPIYYFFQCVKISACKTNSVESFHPSCARNVFIYRTLHTSFKHLSFLTGPLCVLSCLESLEDSSTLLMCIRSTTYIFQNIWI